LVGTPPHRHALDQASLLFDGRSIEDLREDARVIAHQIGWAVAIVSTPICTFSSSGSPDSRR